MITQIKERYKINDPEFLYHVVVNDYIVYGSKIKNSINRLRSLTLLRRLLYDAKEYDNKTLFMPSPVRVEDYYSRQGEYIIGKYIELNNGLLLLSLNISRLSDEDLSIILRDIAIYSSISSLFEHMIEFIQYRQITQYKAGYEEFNRDINDIANKIVDYIRNKYPDAQADENLLQNINRFFHWYLSDSIDSIHNKFIDNFYDLFKSPIIIRLRRIKIKLESLIAIKPYHRDKRYSKTTKNFITNAAISSFIKFLLISLWQLSNEDALSVLVKPQVEYKVVHDKDYEHAIMSIVESESHKIKSIVVKPNYHLILIIGYTLSNSIKPISISLNIFGLSFYLKSKSIKTFVIALSEAISNAYESVIKKFSHTNLVCSRLAV